MRCLVTGGAGFIGSSLVDKLIKMGFEVIVIDNESANENEKFYWNEKAENYKYDICNYHKIRKLFAEVQWVFHLAAQSRIQPSLIDPSYTIEVNCHGTENVLHACVENKVNKIIYSSSSSVYGMTNMIPHKENMPLDCLNPYAISKSTGEKLCKMYADIYKLEIVILRYFNVVGASPSKKIGQINKDDQLFKNLSLAIMKKDPVFNIYGNDYDTFDGTCVRDFIHVCDLADIHIQTLLKLNNLSKSVVLNCGYGRGLSVFEVMKEFRNFSKNNVEINFMQRRNGDIVEMVSNTKKLKKFLKWKPKFYDLKKMVKSSIDWEEKLN